jgi:hypothetical protein
VENQVAFYVDIFEKQNSISLKLQGCNGTLLAYRNTLSSFIVELKLWEKKVRTRKGRSMGQCLVESAVSTALTTDEEKRTKSKPFTFPQPIILLGSKRLL